MRNCLVCQKVLTIKQSKYCSYKCVHKSPDRNNKIRQSKIGEKNPNWAGNKVKYKGLHIWVRSRLPKPTLCEKCNIGKAIDLANKGIYSRDLSQWEWLCRKCHMMSDGRINNMIETIRKFKLDKKYSIKCLICGIVKKTHRPDTRFCSKKCLTKNGNNKRLGYAYF